MKAFTTFTGIVAAIDRPNVDTDAIIPKQYLKSIKRSGFGPHLFDDERYLDTGEPGIDNNTRRLNPNFLLNQEPYNKAEILITRENFGCGSSREHAVWALDDFGIRCIIGTSFADIFLSNAFKNGLLLISLALEKINDLFEMASEQKEFLLNINLAEQVIQLPTGENIHFAVEQELKNRLLNGLDDISISLQHADAIRAYEQKRKLKTPWIFPDL